jgi:hypothetical protein
MTRQAFFITLLTPFVAAACRTLGLTLPAWARPKPHPDAVLISLIRRSMPKLVAANICGVQPMTGPTGLIFAMKAHYEKQKAPA